MRLFYLEISLFIKVNYFKISILIEFFYSQIFIFIRLFQILNCLMLKYFKANGTNNRNNYFILLSLLFFSSL